VSVSSSIFVIRMQYLELTGFIVGDDNRALKQERKW
jgi:hypothetical protein